MLIKYYSANTNDNRMSNYVFVFSILALAEDNSCYWLEPLVATSSYGHHALYKQNIHPYKIAMDTLGTKQLNLHNLSPHIRVGQGIFQCGWRGAKHFSSWRLNDEHNLTVLVKGGRHLFKLPGGGARQNISLWWIPRRKGLAVQLFGPLYEITITWCIRFISQPP